MARDPTKGNCLACHRIPDDPAAVTSADIGPPLENLGNRFPDRTILRQRIWDSSRINPNSLMPPFGRNGILSTDEIELVVDYLYSLNPRGGQ